MSLFRSNTDPAVAQLVTAGKGYITNSISQAEQLSRWLNKFLFNKQRTPQASADAFGTDAADAFAAVVAAEAYVAATNQIGGDNSTPATFLNPGWSYKPQADGTVQMIGPTAATTAAAGAATPAT